MQRIFLMFFLTGALFLASCSQGEQIEPGEVLNKYTNLWKEQEFEQMYEMLTEETREKYDPEDFILRYEKIYQDLDINKIAIDIDRENVEKKADLVSFPIKVSLHSIAGQIQFKTSIQLKAFTDDETNSQTWQVNWSPKLIFPELAKGGKLRIEKEEPDRGEILDRNEMPLAINDIAYEVGIVPGDFSNKEVEIEQVSNLLHISKSNIIEKVEAEWVQAEHFVPLKKIPKSDDETIKQLKLIPAVDLRETIGRTYPSSKATSHLVGYVGKVTDEELKDLKGKGYTENDFIGKRGLEKLYEEKLRGEAGFKILVEHTDEKGDAVLTPIAEKPVKNGENIHLTIDVNLQELIYEQYEGKLKGAAAAVHPTTGEILALVSSPSYDPISLTYGISQAQWEALMNDQGQPFVNRFAALYAPGSVIKPITGMIGLKNGSITKDEGIVIEGLKWKKSNWKDFYVSRVSSSSGPVDLKDALIRSDNIFFAMKAVDMGNDRMVDGLEAFGFNEEIPIDFPFSTSQISNSGELKSEALRANTAYGQGEIEVSSLHLALLYTPILNEGDLVKPNLLLDDKKGTVWKEKLVSPDDLTYLKDSLRKVVTEGTATKIKDSKIDISGKTGTVELKASRDSKGHENAWFVGYPTEDEDLIIALLIEESENIGTSGLAAEKVAKIINEYKTLD